jgi:hypothetical protein
MDAPGIRYRIHVVVIAAALLAVPAQSIAGPPLLCRPFEIGSAPSLPWGTGGWNSPAANSPLDHLITDTLSLLSPEAPVLARMETIRRATIYASRDVRVAADLLSAVSRRALERNSSTSDPHAWFDFGYLGETFKQADRLPLQERQPGKWHGRISSHPKGDCTEIERGRRHGIRRCARH